MRTRLMGVSFRFLLLFCRGSDLRGGTCHGIHDQVLGTHGGTQTAGITLAVIDDRQILGDGDGALGADLLTQTAANAAHSTATCGNRALSQRITGDNYIPARLHRHN